ncbi:MAG: PucR family transcriptional regulator [Desulfitobacteriia bacterium]
MRIGRWSEKSGCSLLFRVIPGCYENLCVVITANIGLRLLFLVKHTVFNNKAKEWFAVIWVSQLLLATNHLFPKATGNLERGFSNFLLVKDSSDIKPDFFYTLYLRNSEKRLLMHSGDCELVISYPSEKTFDVIQVVTEVFNNYPYSEKALLDLMADMKDLNDLARFIGEMLGNNPVVIADSAYNVLAGYLPPNSPLNDPMVQTYINGYFPYDYLARIQKQGEEIRMSSGLYTSKPYICTMDGCKYRRLIKKLIHQDKWLGGVCVMEYTQTFDNIDLKLFDRIGNIITMILASEHYSIKNAEDLYSKNCLIRDILDGKISNSYVLEYRMELCGLNAKKRRFVIAIQINQFRFSGSANDELQNLLMGLFPGSIYLFYDGFLVVVAEEGTKKALSSEKLIDCLTRMQLVFGVSNTFTDMLSLPQYFRQAVQTLYLAKILKKQDYIHYYSSFQFQILLIESKKHHSDWEALQNQLIQKIKEYDDNNGTEYYKTLQSYLKNDKNVIRTSEELCVHKNTVVYRIQRLSELFDLDFTDAEQMFELYSAIKIQEILDCTPSYYFEQPLNQ